MADLFDGYPLGSVWDEMFGEAGRARPAYTGLFASMQPIDGEELAARADLLSQTYRDAGVTFAHAFDRDRHPARHPGPGPRLRRRPAVQGPVLRAQERGPHGDGGGPPPRLTAFSALNAVGLERDGPPVRRLVHKTPR